MYRLGEEQCTDNYRYFEAVKWNNVYEVWRKLIQTITIFQNPTGVRYQKGFGTVGSKKYYFNPSDGKATDRLA